MSKAKQVREMIAQAKAKGVDVQELISAVMERLGFGRQLARTYLLGNWDRVEAAAPVETARAKRALSMSKDAVRKREQRAAKRAAQAAA